VDGADDRETERRVEGMDEDRPVLALGQDRVVGVERASDRLGERGLEVARPRLDEPLPVAREPREPGDRTPRRARREKPVEGLPFQATRST